MPLRQKRSYITSKLKLKVYSISPPQKKKQTRIELKVFQVIFFIFSKALLYKHLQIYSKYLNKTSHTKVFLERCMFVLCKPI